VLSLKTKFTENQRFFDTFGFFTGKLSEINFWTIFDYLDRFVTKLPMKAVNLVKNLVKVGVELELENRVWNQMFSDLLSFFSWNPIKFKFE
jgi:hypothetical protein